MAAKPDTRHNVIGLMSGTSTDGVSACLVEITGNHLNTRVELRAYGTYPYEKTLREALLGITNTPHASLEDIARLNVLLGRTFASAAKEVARKADIPLGEIDLIGSHGHTVIHRPQPSHNDSNENNPSFTLQIGEPSVIAHETGTTTVADFRMRDVAAGGSGAPLVPYADYLLLRHPTLSRAVQNIGGIANVTFLPHGSTSTIDDIIAFDTGPGNMIIDRITHIITNGEREYDDGGRLAQKGRIDDTLMSRLMNHPYLKTTPPKSTGREDFGSQFTDGLYKEAKANACDDYTILATVTAFTAKSIADSYERFIIPRHEISEIILCGGGTKNHTLVKHLKNFLGEISVKVIDDFGIPAQAKEPLSFAVLANETMCGNPGNVPRATGAREAVVLGKIIPGRNWKDIIRW